MNLLKYSDTLIVVNGFTMFFRNPINVLLERLVEQIQSTLDTKLGQFMTSVSEQLAALSEAQAVTGENITAILTTIQSELEQFKQLFQDILDEETDELNGEILDRLTEAVEKQTAMNAQLQSVIEAVGSMSEMTTAIESTDPSEP